MLAYEDIILHCARKGYGKLFATYWAQHPGCEVCGRESAAPHHIRTRGAGGSDDKGNLLSLCTFHHAMIHRSGASRFCREYPGVAEKVKRALGAPRA